MIMQKYLIATILKDVEILFAMWVNDMTLWLILTGELLVIFVLFDISKYYVVQLSSHDFYF